MSRCQERAAERAPKGRSGWDGAGDDDGGKEGAGLREELIRQCEKTRERASDKKKSVWT